MTKHVRNGNDKHMECPYCGHATVRFCKEKGGFVCHHCRREKIFFSLNDELKKVSSPAK